MSAELRLFNSLSRAIEPFQPIHPGEARVYTCGPTVYNFQHIGNMRAYVFADTLGRVLSFKGLQLLHVINITDVGHLTSDADEGADKMEQAASKAGKSAWDIAQFYTENYWRDIDRLNIRQPYEWSIATKYVPAMIEFAKGFAETNCYELESGLYFDTSTVPDYGRLARARTDDGESLIEAVEGIQVGLQRRRQLHQQRAGTVAEFAPPAVQPLDPDLGRPQPARVCQAAGCFDRHHETRWQLVTPAGEPGVR